MRKMYLRAGLSTLHVPPCGTLLYWFADVFPELGFLDFSKYIIIIYIIKKGAAKLRLAWGERSAPFVMLMNLKRRGREARPKPNS